MPAVDQVFCVVTKVVPTPSFLERAGLDEGGQSCRISWRRHRSSFKVNHVKYLMLLKSLPQRVLTGCSEYLSSAQRKSPARLRRSDACRPLPLSADALWTELPSTWVQRPGPETEPMRQVPSTGGSLVAGSDRGTAP